MRVVSWNIEAKDGIGRGRLARVCESLSRARPDVVLLQEVWTDPETVGRVEKALALLGLEGFLFSGRWKDKKKRYGCVIGSRYPLAAAPRRWTDGAPYPQLLARAATNVDGVDVDLISAHIPNGRGNGWKKIETLEVLGGVLRLSSTFV